MRLSPIIPFGAWQPDLPSLGTKSATEIINAVPSNGAYAPIRELAVSGAVGVSAPQSGLRLGGTWLSSNAGVFFDGFLIVAGPNWVLEQWGGSVVASNGTALRRGSAGVLNVVADAPGASVLKRVNNFLVLGNITGLPHFIQWSAFNDATNFAPSKVSQADINDMGSEFGAVMGIIGGDYGYVLQERSISRMAYSGPPTIFNFSRLSDDKGCISKGSVVDTPFGSGFFSQDGPNIVQGDTIKPICGGTFEKWFATNFNPAWPVNGGYDWSGKIILWSWNEGSQAKGLAYSVTEDRATLLDRPYVVYLNDGNQLYGVDTSGRTGQFTGPNARATLTTGELQLEPQRRSFVGEIWPIVDSPVKSASAGVRVEQEVVYTTEYAANEAGMVPCRSSARAHRFKITIPRGEDWTFAQGVQIGFRPEGRM